MAVKGKKSRRLHRAGDGVYSGFGVPGYFT